MPTVRRPPVRCPCGSGQRYADCCGALHAGLAHGSALAQTPERLMRSRYSAYAVGDAAYLLATWHPSTRPSSLELGDAIDWRQLDVLEVTGTPDDDAGIVEFIAYYAGEDGQLAQLRERSRFVREGGRWLYVDAIA